MNYAKLQCDIIKWAMKDSLKDRTKYLHSMYDGDHAIAIDGHAVVIIPDFLYMLDTDKTWHGVKGFNADTVINFGDADAKLLSCDGTTRVVKDDKLPVKEFKLGETVIHVSTRYTKLFDDEALYYGTSPVSPVYVVDENFMLLGMILPVLVR